MQTNSKACMNYQKERYRGKRKGPGTRAQANSTLLNHVEDSAESESVNISISAPLVWAEMEWGPHSHFQQSLQHGLVRL